MFDPNVAKMQKIALDIFTTTFNNAYNSMIHFQEQNEKTCSNFVDMTFRQLECCKKQSVATFDDWVEGVQNSRREFKSAVDDGYALMQDILNEVSGMNNVSKPDKEK